MSHARKTTLTFAGLLAATGLLVACDAASSGTTEVSPSPLGHVSVQIDTHVPYGTRDIAWDLTLDADGPASQLFPWAQRLVPSWSSSGGSSVHYSSVPCQPGASNTLTASFLGVYDAHVRVRSEAGDPAPAGATPLVVDVEPFVREVACVAGEVTHVRLEAWAIPQAPDLLDGPSAAFGAWACAPSLGCAIGDDERTTLTLDLSCAANDEHARPELALEDIELRCDGETVAILDPTADLAEDDLAVAVSRDHTEVVGAVSARWSIAVEVPSDLLTSGECHLQTAGTACDETPYAGSRCYEGTIHAGSVHPYIVWDATVSRDGELRCWNRDLGTDGIAAFYTAYDATADLSFPYLYSPW